MILRRSFFVPKNSRFYLYCGGFCDIMLNGVKKTHTFRFCTVPFVIYLAGLAARIYKG